MTPDCVLYLWCEKPLYPTGQERFIKDAADRGPFSRAAFEKLCQKRAQILRVVDGNGWVRTTDDLQY